MGTFTIDYYKLNTKKKDECLGLFVCMYLLFDAVNSMLQDVFKISGSTYQLTRCIIAMALVVFVVNGLVHFNRRDWKVLFLWEFVGVACYVYSYLVGSPISKLIGWAGTTLAVCVPIAVFTYLIEDKAVLYGQFKKMSWVLLAILLIDMVGSKDDYYNIHFTYAVLFCMLIHFNELVNGNKRVLHFLVLCMEFFMILMYGSRGGLVCLVAYVLIKIYFNVKDKKVTVKYSLLFLFAIAALLIILAFGNEIYSILRSMGVKSRTLKLFLTGRFASHDSGSGELYKTVRSLIMQKPLTGWGIRGSVSVLGHPYPHQFFYDLVLTFGIPIGVCMIIALCLPMVKVFTTKRGLNRDMLQMFFSIGFVALMFMNTLFTDYYYFIFLGLVASCFYTPKLGSVRGKV